MKKYCYQAYKEETDELINGFVDAESPRAAREKISQLGFMPTKVYEEGSVQAQTITPQSQLDPGHRVNRLSLNEKIQLTSELGVLLSSQIPIIEALDSISTGASDFKIKRVVTGLRTSILNGSSFKEAMEKYGDVFDPVFVGLVSAGELSGDMDKTFGRLSELLKKQKAIKDKAISASIYPGILVALTLGVIVIFGGFVIPKLATTYAMTGTELPYFTQKIIGIINFFKVYWIFSVVGIAGCIYGLHALFKDVDFKAKFDKFILKIPLISNLNRMINLSNFMAVLGVAYDAGVPIVQAVQIASTTLKNLFIKSKINGMIDLLNKGKSLHDVFSMTDFLEPASNNMIKAGEKAGNLGKMVNDVADMYDKKVELATEALAKAFEPCMIVIMGVVVCILLAAFFPLIMGIATVGM
ncbi:MAG: type II secretion system F family protein [Clostridiaceae bacterium]|jgi:general secretion pathway protein F|nr:type II secretion system F family protein [Clostridiaceae bacterium]